MMDQRNTETVLEALAERIRDMRTEIFLKDAQIESLRARIAELEGKAEACSDGKN